MLCSCLAAVEEEEVLVVFLGDLGVVGFVVLEVVVFFLVVVDVFFEVDLEEVDFLVVETFISFSTIFSISMVWQDCSLMFSIVKVRLSERLTASRKIVISPSVILWSQLGLRKRGRVIR